MSDLRGVAFFEWQGKHGFLNAKNRETELLTHRISSRQMKLFLTLLAQIERAIAEPQTSDRLGSWMVGYLAGWTSPLLGVNCGPADHPEEKCAVKTSQPSLLEDSEGFVPHLRLDPNSQFPSVSSSADGESGDSVAAGPRTNVTASSAAEGE